MPLGEKAHFRKDINGLRAVAVLGVILFHLSVPGFGGGFLGVDVFLTISGYLITGSIVRDMKAERFSFAGFYYRRTRRLAPALLVTVACSLVAAIYILPPSYLIQTSKASLAAIVSVSNIFFWLESGYFSADAITKPLLHTWSLGVEEQFYLIWPLLIVLGLRFRSLWAGLFALLAASLVASQIAVVHAPNAAFYLLPFRAFEFAIGASVCLTEQVWRRTGYLNEVIKLLALCAIVASLFLFDAKMPFPGVYALVPCVATAVLIQAGPTRLVRPLLENPLATIIGRISYSLYLVHWPLVVFYSFVAFREITGREKMALLAVTFALGALLYYLVEQRFRRYDFRTKTRSIYVSFGLTALLCFVAVAAWSGQGWAWRSPGYLSADFVQQQKDKRFTELIRICNKRSWETCWNVVPTDKKRILVIGDSEATDGVNAILPALGREYVILNELPGCPPFTATSSILKLEIPDRANCIAANKKRLDPTYLGKFDVIVISALWQWYTPQHLDELLDYLKAEVPKAKVIVFGSYFQLRHPCWEYMERKKTVDCVTTENIDERFDFEKRLKQATTSHGYLYISKQDLFCKQGQSCRVFADDSKKIPMTWDEFHLSYEFATLLGTRAKSAIENYVYGPDRPSP